MHGLFFHRPHMYRISVYQVRYAYPTCATLPLLQEIKMKQEKNYEKELDYRTNTVNILSGRCEKIYVTGWDEVEEIEKDEPIRFLRWDEWEKYYENRYFCTTTRNGKLPL